MEFMTVITIREQGKTETGFNATLAIAGNNYNITVNDPFDDREEQEYNKRQIQEIFPYRTLCWLK